MWCYWCVCVCVCVFWVVKANSMRVYMSICIQYNSKKRSHHSSLPFSRHLLHHLDMAVVWMMTFGYSPVWFKKKFISEYIFCLKIVFRWEETTCYSFVQQKRTWSLYLKCILINVKWWCSVTGRWPSLWGKSSCDAKCQQLCVWVCLTFLPSSGMVCKRNPN